MGNQSRRVWGYVHVGEGTLASYFMQWTVGKSIESHPANFDLVCGAWGDGATREDRYAISLVYFEKCFFVSQRKMPLATDNCCTITLVMYALLKNYIQFVLNQFIFW